MRGHYFYLLYHRMEQLQINGIRAMDSALSIQLLSHQLFQ